MDDASPADEVEIHIAARPEAVWAMVSDVRRTPEWSPECRRVVVLGGGSVRLGSWLFGLNRKGRVVWPTFSKVHVFDKGRSIGWHTRDSGARWTYEVEPAEGGCLLRERRHLPHGPTWGTRLFAGAFLGGADAHADELRVDMRTTVGRIKARAEAATTVG